jgi:hypothetical protein
MEHGLSSDSARSAARQWAAPDSAFATQAFKIAQTLCPEFMIRYCFRTDCFSAVFAARDHLKLDRERSFVTAILNHLALGAKYADDPGSFEWVGTKLADIFCRNDEREQRGPSTSI